MPTADNDPGRWEVRLPDAHGQAALLLVESLIHKLLTRSIISTDDAIDIVDSADSVLVDIAEDFGAEGVPLWQAHTFLCAMVASLKIDGSGYRRWSCQTSRPG